MYWEYFHRRLTWLQRKELISTFISPFWRKYKQLSMTDFQLLNPKYQSTLASLSKREAQWPSATEQAPGFNPELVLGSVQSLVYDLFLWVSS